MATTNILFLALLAGRAVVPACAVRDSAEVVSDMNLVDQVLVDQVSVDQVSVDQVCVVSEAPGKPTFGVSFAYKVPKKGNKKSCSVIQCAPVTFTETYLHPENNKGFIRARLSENGKKCHCTSATSYRGDKEKLLTYYHMRENSKCTSTHCWWSYNDQRIRERDTQPSSGFSAGDTLTSGNHWVSKCQDGAESVVLPPTKETKKLEEEAEETRLIFEAQEEARRQAEEAQDKERRALLARQNAAAAERVRKDEARKAAEEKETKRLEAEAERLVEAAKKKQTIERAAAEAIAQAKQRAAEVVARIAKEETDRENLKQKRLNEQEAEDNRIARISRAAVEKAAKKKNVDLDPSSVEITLSWDTANVDLDLRFYEKSWLEGVSSAWQKQRQHVFHSNKESHGWKLQMDDLGNDADVHVETVFLVGDKTVIPDGDYVAFVELYKDDRQGSDRSSIPWTMSLARVGSARDNNQVTGSFVAPLVAGDIVYVQMGHQFEFAVKSNKVEWKTPVPRTTSP